MYKCKECGAEYEEKPDYCDCGNDEFDVVGVNNIQEEKPKEKIEEKSVEMPKGQVIQEKSKALSASAMNFNNSAAQNSYIPKRILTVAPAPLIFFLGCILLSLYIMFFAWNPKEDLTKIEALPKTEASKNIPSSIDKFWNNALPAVKQPEPNKEEKFENIVKQIISIEPQKKTETVKVVSVPKVTPTPKVTKVPLIKVTSTPKKTVTNTAAKQQASNTQTQTKQSAEDAAKKKAEAERKAAETAQIKKLQAEQAKRAAEENAKQTAAAKQEFVNYKAQLRNTIGRKIDFTRVIGDGSCTVAFKIDPNGKLTNRSFAKQSSNNTLNDAVYAAVMATPTFNPPPSAYNNEILNLNIRFNNGNFEISLP